MDAAILRYHKPMSLTMIDNNDVNSKICELPDNAIQLRPDLQARSVKFTRQNHENLSNNETDIAGFDMPMLETQYRQ